MLDLGSVVLFGSYHHAVEMSFKFQIGSPVSLRTATIVVDRPET